MVASGHAEGCGGHGSSQARVLDSPAQGGELIARLESRLKTITIKLAFAKESLASAGGISCKVLTTRAGATLAANQEEGEQVCFDIVQGNKSVAPEVRLRRRARKRW